jgi:hypothetical protein
MAYVSGAVRGPRGHLAARVGLTASCGLMLVLAMYVSAVAYAQGAPATLRHTFLFMGAMVPVAVAIGTLIVLASGEDKPRGSARR